MINLPDLQAAWTLYADAKAPETLHALIDVFAPDTSLAHFGGSPAEPVLGDVLQLRRAMGCVVL